MKITLLLFKPRGRQKEIPLRVPVAVVGRSKGCQIQLVDTRVSRRHCVLALSGGKLRVTDLDSSTGTYVNGKRVTRASLKHGDTVSVGRFLLRVQVEAGGQEDAQTGAPGDGLLEGHYVPRRKIAARRLDDADDASDREEAKTAALPVLVPKSADAVADDVEAGARDQAEDTPESFGLGSPPRFTAAGGPFQQAEEQWVAGAPEPQGTAQFAGQGGAGEGTHPGDEPAAQAERHDAQARREAAEAQRRQAMARQEAAEAQAREAKASLEIAEAQRREARARQEAAEAERHAAKARQDATEAEKLEAAAGQETAEAQRREAVARREAAESQRREAVARQGKAEAQRQETVIRQQAAEAQAQEARARQQAAEAERQGARARQEAAEAELLEAQARQDAAEAEARQAKARQETVEARRRQAAVGEEAAEAERQEAQAREEAAQAERRQAKARQEAAEAERQEAQARQEAAKAERHAAEVLAEAAQAQQLEAQARHEAAEAQRQEAHARQEAAEAQQREAQARQEMAESERREALEDVVVADADEDLEEPIHTERFDLADEELPDAQEEPMTYASGPDAGPSRDAGWRTRGEPALVPAGRGQLAGGDGGIFAGDPITGAASPSPDAVRRKLSLGMLLRFKWSILIVFLLIAVPSITAIWMLMTPKYQARSEIHVKPVIPWIVFKGFAPEQISGRYESYMNTQVSVIRSPTVLGRVLDRDDVRKTAWFRDPPSSVLAKITGTLSPIERLRDDLSVSPRGRTELMDVTMSALGGEDTATIANAVVEEYLKYNSDKVDENADLQHRKRTEKFTALKQEIEGRKKILDKLQRDLGTSDPKELVANIRVRLDEKEANLESVRSQLKISLWQYKQAAQNVLALLREDTERLRLVLQEDLKTQDSQSLLAGPADQAKPSGAEPPNANGPLEIALSVHDGLVQQVEDAEARFEVARDLYGFAMGASQSIDEDNAKHRARLARRQDELQNEIRSQAQNLAVHPQDAPASMPSTQPSGRQATTTAPQDRKEQEAKLAALRRSLDTVSWKLKEVDRLAKARKDNPGKEIAKPPKNPGYDRDYTWRELKQSEMAAKQRYEYESQRLKPAHPTIVELKRIADKAEELVKAREAELDKQTEEDQARLPKTEQMAIADPQRAEWFRKLDKARADLRAEAQAIRLLQHKEGIFRAEVEAADAKFKGVFDNAEMLRRENDALGQRQEAYNGLRDLLFKTQMERDVPGAIEVLSKAAVPSKPSSDRRIVLTIMAAFLAFGAGVALALYRGLTQKQIQETKDLPLVLRTPFLGHLPFVQSKGGSPPGQDPTYCEGVRMVRTALLSRIEGRKGSAVMVTSAGIGVGKSTLSAALAKSLAQSGKEVLLVDADVRNPRLASLFGTESDGGFLACLRDRDNVPAAVIKTDIDGLSFLPAGKCRQPSDVELISNGAFSACLKRWRHEYDLVLLDGSPLLPVADARIIAGKIDGAIMVVREGLCTRDEILDALEYLGAGGGNLLGTVLIGSPRHKGYGYHYYKYGYGYAKDHH